MLKRGSAISDRFMNKLYPIASNSQQGASQSAVCEKFLDDLFRQRQDILVIKSHQHCSHFPHFTTCYLVRVDLNHRHNPARAARNESFFNQRYLIDFSCLDAGFDPFLFRNSQYGLSAATDQNTASCGAENAIANVKEVAGHSFEDTPFCCKQYLEYVAADSLPVNCGSADKRGLFQGWFLAAIPRNLNTNAFAVNLRREWLQRLKQDVDHPWLYGCIQD